jgi:hypothetical protein
VSAAATDGKHGTVVQHLKIAMKSELRYIELKSGFGDNGPAWIGMAEFSKSGRTVYFKGKAMKNSNAKGIAGNYFDIETGEEYWISGIKKDGSDRHWAGGGKIMIDENIIDLYLSKVDFDQLDKRKFEIVNIEPTDKTKFTELENEKLS